MLALDGGLFNYGTSAFFGSAVAPNNPSPAPGPVVQSCTVSLSNYNPPDYTNITATIASNVLNSAVSTCPSESRRRCSLERTLSESGRALGTT